MKIGTVDFVTKPFDLKRHYYLIQFHVQRSDSEDGACAWSIKMEPIKLVVRFTDGRIRKGYSQDFSPNKPIFRLVKDRTGAGEVEEINLANLKAVFFVKTFTGNPDRKEKNRFTKGDIPKGRKVEVTFADGEVFAWNGYGVQPEGSRLFPLSRRSPE